MPQIRKTIEEKLASHAARQTRYRLRCQAGPVRPLLDAAPAAEDADDILPSAEPFDGLAELFAEAQLDVAPHSPLGVAPNAEEAPELEVNEDEQSDDLSESAAIPISISCLRQSTSPHDPLLRHSSPVSPFFFQSRSRSSSRETASSIADSDVAEDESAEDLPAHDERASDSNYSDNEDDIAISDISDRDSVAEEIEIGPAVADLLQKAWDPVCYCSMHSSKNLHHDPHL